MQNAIQIPKAVFVFTTILVFLNGSSGEPRAQTVQIMCGNERINNATTYVPNFVATMENVREQMRNLGFGVAVTGSGLDTNYGLANCYGDLSLDDCVLCYAEARTVLPQCFPYSGGRIYLDGCFMRTENYSFFEEYRGSQDQAVCGNTTRRNSVFQETARRSVLEAVLNASNNNNYARIESAVSGTVNESAYVLADCWRTLTASACRSCLQNASASLLGCLPWNEGRALFTGCFMRYSDINFLNPILRTEGNSRATRNNRLIIYVACSTSAAAIVLLGLLVIVILYIRCRKKQQRKNVLKKKGMSEEGSERSESHKENLELPLFEYAIIAEATNTFSDDNKLGEGGFGPVYKGILEDGQEVAVKKLSQSSRQGVEEFKNEVLCIAKLQHRNLVKLLGCCIHVEKILVYEYMPNKSLDYFIFDERQRKLLDWDKHFKIINGISRGLLYLHQDSRLRIIHRDLKASNILLDYEMNPKISDFGMARSFRDHETEANTNRVVGTYGYMSPEYAIDGLFSVKSDVFSFGVLVLETVSGKKNRGFIHQDHSLNLLGHAWNLHNEGRYMELVNECIRDSFNEFEALRSIHVALLCVQQSPEDRPSMSTVVLMLSSDAELPQPKLPGFYGERVLLFQGNSSQYDCVSANEMTDTIIDPR